MTEAWFPPSLGVVPPTSRAMGKEGIETLNIGNSDLPPEWGVDLVIHAGSIVYGPWADRQRRVEFFYFIFDT